MDNVFEYICDNCGVRLGSHSGHNADCRGGTSVFNKSGYAILKAIEESRYYAIFASDLNCKTAKACANANGDDGDEELNLEDFIIVSRGKEIPTKIFDFA